MCIYAKKFIFFFLLVFFMVAYDEVSILCPCNDGESKVIVDIAKRLGLDVRVSNQGWGATLDGEPEDSFLDLRRVVFVVEMPSLVVEKRLEDQGHVLKIIDHHKYDSLDRSHELSSLEQFASFFNYDLNRFERGVALNDRGYIYLLRDEGFSLDEIKEIREFDLDTQMYSQGLNVNMVKAISVQALHEAVLRNGVLVVTLPVQYTMYLLDLVKLKDLSKRQDLLTVCFVNGFPTLVQFFGEFAFVEKLFDSLGGFMGGDRDREGFWCLKENIDLEKLFVLVDAK